MRGDEPLEIQFISPRRSEQVVGMDSKMSVAIQFRHVLSYSYWALKNRLHTYFAVETVVFPASALFFCLFVWFNVRQPNNGYLDVDFWERNPAQGLRITNEMNAFTLVASLPRKYDIITTRHNPATQQISIRV
jgi:hypothetical protein